MKTISFKNKILLLVVTPLILVSLSLVVLSVYQSQTLGTKNAQAFENLMFELRRSELKNYTEVSLTTVKDLYNENSGVASNYKEANENIVNNLDFIGDDFFFVYDYKSVISDLGRSVGDIEAELNKNVIDTFRLTSILVLLFSVLVGLIVMRITAHEGRMADEKLQDLSRQVVQIQEEERGKLARDLQKLVNKNLVAIRTKWDSLVKGSSMRESKKGSEFILSMKVLDKAIYELHRISGELRPAILDRVGLFLSVKKFVEDFREEKDIDISFKSMGETGQLRTEVETSIYRIVQVSLENIFEYSNNPEITVRLVFAQNRIKVNIQDRSASFNMRNMMGEKSVGDMQIRIESLGGVFAVFSEKGVGTIIKFEVPA